jgi:hypothetical protein
MYDILMNGGHSCKIAGLEIVYCARGCVLNHLPSKQIPRTSSQWSRSYSAVTLSPQAPHSPPRHGRGRGLAPANPMAAAVPNGHTAAAGDDDAPPAASSSLVFLGTGCSSAVPNARCLIQPPDPPCPVCSQSLSVPPELNPNYRCRLASSRPSSLTLWEFRVVLRRGVSVVVFSVFTYHHGVGADLWWYEIGEVWPGYCY